MECRETLASAEANGVLLPKAAVGAVITAAVVAIATSIGLGIALAKKSPQP